ncbi:MAG: hybrid sensor histidine kinase/response regulator [Cyanobacteriota bacterium]|nr:hybrid sensor histidine kinase/response regulator [Cyanobacteriota bacterium]
MTHPFFADTPKSDRILVVDDAPDNLFLVQSILDEEGYESILVEDGASALAEIENSPPDLLLLDVMMPGIDGFEVTKRIRDHPTLPYIPILLITAYDEASVVRGLDSGADDFIRKPVEVEELLARVRSLLRLKHSVDERDLVARQREDFVSRLAHDLRTPLVAADRTLALMGEGALGELSPAMEEALAIMSRSNHNLLEMVNTLLEVYRHEAGRKIYNFSRVDLGALVAEAVEELSSLAREKGLDLSCNCLKGAKACVQGDRLELYRVLTNLIGNAIKFTDRGSVEIRLATTESVAAIEVEDTGPGISPEERKTLFERFRQGRHKRAGSGLGLHLSSRIIESHRGTIEVRSQLGSGSLFAVRLPLAQT